MDKIRLKIAIILAIIFSATHISAQTTMKDLIGLPIDSIGFNITMDSTNVENISDVPQLQRAVARISGNELHPHIPTSYPINKTKDVGEIACNSNVSPTGAMTINVPIEAYQSPDGFTPQISLTYNSLAGNGPVGWGWNIAGTSVISKEYSNKLNKVSKGYSIYGIANSWYDYAHGENSFSGAILDTVFGIGSNAGYYGAWVGLWYELGKEYGPIHRFLYNK